MNGLSVRNLFDPTAILAMALMAIIAMMILPMPSWLLDAGLALSFAVAILIFTITLFVERPLDFSAFPTILLASLLLRLSLNVSSTKLIIGQGHTGVDAAGHVIEGFAMFIMGGSVVLGLVIFCVLLIVNFVVINKGAARMAEVGARFALDAMPGKQLAIDADMAAGAIDHKEASARREREQAETTFFGSLDGASKFIKGDAVAGLVITSLNLVVGLCVGIFVHDMAPSAAVETYTILTVGDGLVSQIPAVITSVAAALLLARGGAKGATQAAIVDQLGRYPAALGTVALLMALFAIVPGLPFLPFMAGAVGLGAAAVAGVRARERRAKASTSVVDRPAPAAREATLGDILDLDDIHVEFAPDLVDMVLDPATGLDARISNMRNHVATAFGMLLPEIRLTDNPALPRGTYLVRVQGVEQARDVLRPGRLLVLAGENTADAGEQVREPVYGAPAIWVPPEERERSALLGLTVVTPPEVLATHLLEVIKRNLARLLSLRVLRRILDEMVNLSDGRRNDMNRRMLDELIPERVPLDLLLGVLRLLLDERVSIRNMPLILEAVAEGRTVHQTAEGVADHVRQRLGFQLVSDLKREDGTIPLIQLSPDWEKIFSTYQLASDRSGSEIALPPDDFNRLANGLADRIARAAEGGTHAAVVTSSRRRRFLRTVMTAKGIPNPVLSFEEIGIEARPALVGVVAA